MSKHYGEIAFTDRVSAVQDRYGSRPFYARHRARAQTPEGPDPMTPDVLGFLAARDSFYLATTSETGWPYVQYRGGPPGFLQVIDEHTLGWADFRGNLQYISTGNLAELGPRVAEFRDQITKLETENARMRTLLSAGDNKILLRPNTSQQPPSAEGGPGLDLG